MPGGMPEPDCRVKPGKLPLPLSGGALLLQLRTADERFFRYLDLVFLFQALLGLLEYVHDPLRVLSHFAGRSKWLLVSYCGGGTAQTRAREGWVNHLDYAAVEKCVASAGGRIFAVEVDWHQRMWLFDCSRSGAGTQPDESKCLKEAA